MRKSIFFFGSKFSRDEANEQFTPYTNNRHSKMFGTISSSTVNSQNNSLNFTLPRIMNIDMKDPLKSFEFIKNCEKGAFSIHAIEFSNVQYLLQQLICSNSIYSEMPTFQIQVEKDLRVENDNAEQTSSPASPAFSGRRETVSGYGGGSSSGGIRLSPPSPSYDDNSSSSSVGSTITNPSIPSRDVPSVSTGSNERSKIGFGRFKKIFTKMSPSTPSSPKKKKAKISKNLFDSMPNLTKLTLTETFSSENEVESFEGYSFGQLCEYLVVSGVTSLTNLTSLEMLSTHRSVGSRGCKYLANGKLKNLTSLDLSLDVQNETNNGIKSDGCKYLANGNLTHLIQMNLSGNRLYAKGCQYLSNGNLSNMTHLNLSCCAIDFDACQYIGNGNLKNLVQLDLSRNMHIGSGVQFIFNGNLSNLAWLNLESCEIRPSDCAFIGNADVSDLSYLNLSSNPIADEGCTHLSKGKFISLQDFDLRNCKIGSTGFAELTANGIGKLSKLHVDNNSIGDEGCQNMSNLPFLTLLSISNNNLGPKGCRYISLLPQLLKLVISRNNVGSSGCLYLNTLSKLEYLDLIGNDIRDAGCEILCNGSLSNIKSLMVNQNLVSIDGVKFLLSGDFPKISEIHLQDVKDGSLNANLLERSALEEVYSAHKSKVTIK